MVVIGNSADGVHVRFAQETKEYGTKYTSDIFLPEELETVYAHLRRELDELQLRQDLLDAAKKRAEAKKIDEVGAAPKAIDPKVN